MFEPKVKFLWGASTSSHQVEGQNDNNDWWAFEQAGKVIEKSAGACDQYNRYQEDINILSDLGHNAHRFSLEWSRLEPEEGVWSEEAFRHYHDVLDALRAKNIEPVVTIHHFTNPQWFAAKGGWLSPEAKELFLRLVKKIVTEFGPKVSYWITINEPMVYLFYGFYEGIWPPGHKCMHEAVKVFRHMLHTHIAAYKCIHRHYREELDGKAVWVSISKSLIKFEAKNPNSLRDRVAVFFRKWFYNHLFLRALKTGFLFFPGLYCEFLPARDCLDFLGVNYYFRQFVRGHQETHHDLFGEVCSAKEMGERVKETNQMGWEVYPDGLYDVLQIARKYPWPVVITENGICTEDDKQRESFIRRHLASLEKAIESGVPVWGYMHWSLLDNFEWAEGFRPRFGLVGVDYSNMERKVKPSAHVLSECCRKIANSIQ